MAKINSKIQQKIVFDGKEVQTEIDYIGDSLNVSVNSTVAAFNMAAFGTEQPKLQPFLTSNAPV